MSDGRLALRIQESLNSNTSSEAVNQGIIGISGHPSLQKLRAQIKINQTLVDLLNNEMKSAERGEETD